MTTETTPGPWKATIYQRGSFDIHANVDGVKCIITARNSWTYNAEESHANAYLLAAAKELREALLLLMDPMIDVYTHQESLGEKCACKSCAREKAKAAIAKSKGEPA